MNDLIKKSVEWKRRGNGNNWTWRWDVRIKRNLEIKMDESGLMEMWWCKKYSVWSLSDLN